MESNRSSRYSGYRFPSEIISYAIWAYHRFCLSFRDVEDLLVERGILESYETIRLWCQKFGADYVRKLKRLQGRLGDHWHLDEVFLRINGHWQYLWRAIDPDGDVMTSWCSRGVIDALQSGSSAGFYAGKDKSRNPNQLLPRGSHDRALR